MKGDNSLRFEEWPNTTKRCVHITLFIITPITEYKYLGILFKPRVVSLKQLSSCVKRQKKLYSAFIKH